jgi:hypothetical protein
MSDTDFLQPGDPKQLCQAVEAAEKYYEESRNPVIVYWDVVSNRYRIGHTYYKYSDPEYEVVRIPK